MRYKQSDCKCAGCPENGTAACQYLQAENQVKELLLERKILRQIFAKNARQNTAESPGTNSNNASPKCLCHYGTCGDLKGTFYIGKNNACPIHGTSGVA
ncbi:MAG: hypothetical protein PHU14_09075 [Methylovulum sp.]|nr:hypothetical protein [Methylovulum sp.]